MRNPPWQRDELILALDLYFKVNPLHTSEKNPEIVALSELLNKLPIHSERPNLHKFRNPTGVYMKLCNFLRLDPSYDGKGLDAGSKLDEQVWNEFANDRHRLSAVANAIKENYLASSINTGDNQVFTEADNEFSEGRLLARVHIQRERNPNLVKSKKKSVMSKAGKLACEVCGFDFKQKYGDLGDGFAECHHIIPVSKLSAGHKTKLSELAIVCANCHRMLHKARPWLSIEELRSKLC